MILDYMKEGLSMGLIEIASNNSVWRGMEYYEDKKVIAWEKTGEHTYDGSVSGNKVIPTRCISIRSIRENQHVPVHLLMADVLYANI